MFKLFKNRKEQELKSQLDKVKVQLGLYRELNETAELLIDSQSMIIDTLKEKLGSEAEYNELLTQSLANHKKKCDNLQSKLKDIRITDSYQAKYN